MDLRIQAHPDIGILATFDRPRISDASWAIQPILAVTPAEPSLQPPTCKPIFPLAMAVAIAEQSAVCLTWLLRIVGHQ
eukprot:7827437-Alexandrium_andersonii.AAC.1